MRLSAFVAAPAACLALSLLLPSATHAATALGGRVSSAEDGALEGVLVSAKRDGSTITVTVVSDKDGRYEFPAERLAPGHYTLKIRAVGYALTGAGAADIAAGAATTADLPVRKVADVSSQLSNTEWIASLPGTETQKKNLYSCVSCHSLQRIVRSTHDTAEFMQVLQRMASYSPGASPLKPQVRTNTPGMQGDPERYRKRAEYLASINLSQGDRWAYALHAAPRPSGRATRVVITEYDLPHPEWQPHDVVLDAAGTAWFTNFAEQLLGELDPKTGKVIEHTIPMTKPGAPTGLLDIEADAQGNFWIGMMLQGAVAKFDRATRTFQTFPLPAELNTVTAQQAMVMPIQAHRDGKMWFNDVGIPGVHRMDLASGKVETWRPYKDMPRDVEHTVYGIKADSANNLFFLDFSNRNIGRIDAKTGVVALFPTPTEDSRPRRGYMDGQDRLWFAEWGVDRLAMFDTKSQSFQEWKVPTEWTAPYDAIPDKNGELWSGGMQSDKVLRLDPASGSAVEYLLPHVTNIRRVFVDNSTSPPTFWTGNNQGAQVVKLEPLD